jgi:hypothetical protein
MDGMLATEREAAVPKRIVSGLSERRVKTNRKPGLLADGQGLYLRTTPGAKGWVFRYQIAGRRRDMGLGSVTDVSLPEARDLVIGMRRLIRQGIDPIEDRRTNRGAMRVASAKTKTFMECAEAYIAAHRGSWKSPKHRQQWDNTLATYVYPVLGVLPVNAIDVGLIMQVVEPLWSTKSATASRVRGQD